MSVIRTLVVVPVTMLALFGCGSGNKILLRDETSDQSKRNPSLTQVIPADSSSQLYISATGQWNFLPEMIYRQVPNYPKKAKKEKITWTVWIQCLIDEQGNVIKSFVRESSGNDELDMAAYEASLKCKFAPAIQEGKLKKIWVSFPYEFVMTEK
jgi:protein TonB